ncbi:MAG TPA: TIM-barrel domain-containing protein [Ktedonobacterales bacterium]|nr:TIM-barrel domain-containing protein [Ktedonobacterales bacterium]
MRNDFLPTDPVAAVDEPVWHFPGQQDFVTFTLLADDILRIALTPRGAPPHRTWSVEPDCDARRASSFIVEQDETRFTVRTPALTLTLEVQTRVFSIAQADGTPICEQVRLRSAPGEQCWEMALSEGARILGGGERTGGLNRRGRKLTFWTRDALPHFDEHTDEMYQSVPFLVQVARGRVSGLFFDSNWHATADIGRQQPGLLTYSTTGPDLVIYVCAGPTFADVLRQYTSITGHMPPQPRWALGYQQSRWGYTSADEVREVAASFRELSIPCDAIYLDLDYMEGLRDFTWSQERFPDPARLIEDLRAQGFRVVTIIDPGLKVDPDYRVYQEGKERGYFIRAADGATFEGWAWPGKSVWADFARADVQEWWGEQHRALVEAGVAGIWIDMNEPTQTGMFAPPEIHIPHGLSLPLDTLHGPLNEPLTHAEFHNAYGLEMARATRASLERFRPDERPFVLTRATNAGSQRYTIAWNGDTTSSWEHLRMAIPMNLGVGLSGMPMSGCDLGGFWNDTTPELLVRFTQLGAFLPFCRNHSAIGTLRQEPWSFGEPYTGLCRAAIEWRYRLLPYLASLAHEASTTGAPMMRPLCWLAPDDPAALDCDDAFLLGNDLLVAPVLEEVASERHVSLPPGEWFDLTSNAVYTGPGRITLPVQLETVPVFVRAGAILPLAEVVQHTDMPSAEPLTLHVYLAQPDQSGTTVLWDDDDHPQAAARGTFATYRVTAAWEGDTVTVRAEQLDGYLAPRYPAVRVALHVPPAWQVELIGEPPEALPLTASFCVRK